jgi:hypothetical protein
VVPEQLPHLRLLVFSCLIIGWGVGLLPVGYIDAGLKLIAFSTGIFLVYFDRPCKEA